MKNRPPLSKHTDCLHPKDQHGYIGKYIAPGTEPTPAATIQQITATCGHAVRYAMPTNPEHAQAKIARVQGKPCRECRIREANRREQAAIKAKPPSKQQTAENLPAHTRLTLIKLTTGK